VPGKRNNNLKQQKVKGKYDDNDSKDFESVSDCISHSDNDDHRNHNHNNKKDEQEDEDLNL